VAAPANVPGIGPVAAPSDALREAARPKTASDFRIHTDPPIPIASSYTYDIAATALTAHSIGLFYQSGLMADVMRSDDAIAGAFQARALGLFSNEMGWEAGSGKSGAECLALVQGKWDSIASETTLAQIHKCGLQMGFAIAQLVWVVDGKNILPRLYFWHPSLVQWSFPDRCFTVRTLEGLEYAVPGNGQWFVWTPYGDYLGWRDGLINGLMAPWMSRQYAWRDWGRYNEVHGLPQRKVRVPETASEADKLAFQNAMSTIGSEANILLPSAVGGESGVNFDVELLEPTGDSWEAFEKLLSKAETRIAVTVNGQNLTTEVQGGSFAATKMHSQKEIGYFKADNRSLSREINRQIFAPIARYNFGDEAAAPRACWKIVEQDDRLTNAQATQAVAQAITMFQTAGVPVDARRLLTLTGIPVLPGTEGFVLPPPAPAAKPGDAGPPGEQAPKPVISPK